jgi:hypothetical protein
MILLFIGHKLKVSSGRNILYLPAKNISVTIWRYVVSQSVYLNYRRLFINLRIPAKCNTVGHARTNLIGSRTSLVMESVQACIAIFVFRGNPFQAHSLG